MPDLRPRFQRRLAAVLAADVVGSSRLMEKDEEGTVSAIHTILSDIIEPAAARHQGRLVKTMGDGALLEFASPVEAVLCAVEAQAAVGDLARQRPDGEERFSFGWGSTWATSCWTRTATFSGTA